MSSRPGLFLSYFLQLVAEKPGQGPLTPEEGELIKTALFPVGAAIRRGMACEIIEGPRMQRGNMDAKLHALVNFVVRAQWRPSVGEIEAKVREVFADAGAPASEARNVVVAPQDFMERERQYPQIESATRITPLAIDPFEKWDWESVFMERVSEGDFEKDSLIFSMMSFIKTDEGKQRAISGFLAGREKLKAEREASEREMGAAKERSVEVRGNPKGRLAELYRQRGMVA